MAPRAKLAFAAVVLIPLPLFAVAMIVEASSAEQGESSGSVAVALLAVSAVVLWAIGVVWGVLQIARRADMTANEKTAWIGAVALLYPITLPFYWWSLVGGDQGPRSDSSGSAAFSGGALAPLEKAVVAWLLVPPALVILAFMSGILLSWVGAI